MLSLRTHSFLDYVVAAALIACPWIFGFADFSTARDVFVGSGIFMVAYSLCTNDQFAVFRQIPVGPHMMLDFSVGAFVMMAPWIFSYREYILPGQEYVHYFAGVALFAFVAFTRTLRETEKSIRDRREIRARRSAAVRI